MRIVSPYAQYVSYRRERGSSYDPFLSFGYISTSAVISFLMASNDGWGRGQQVFGAIRSRTGATSTTVATTIVLL